MVKTVCHGGSENGRDLNKLVRARSPESLRPPSRKSDI